MDEQKGKIEAAAELRSPFLKKLENFWYHYKWPFLAGVLAVIVLVVSLTQCANNSKNDVYVMYAGGHAIGNTQMRDLEASLAGFAEDRNSDGRISIGIGSYAIYTNEEIASRPIADQGHIKQFSHDNRENFDQEILSGEATLCFLSPSLFEELAEAGALLPLSEYHTAAEGEEAVLYGNTAYGVRLASLALSTYPGLSDLPADTVLAVRAETSLNSLFGAGTAKAMYEANLAMAKRLFTAVPYAPAK